MALQFPSDAWAKAFKDEINQSESYAEAAKNWEGDFYFVIEPEGSMTKRVILYVDLWHGKSREAFEVKDEAEKKPAFRMTAPISTWKQVIYKKLDPLQGLMTNKIKLVGNMAMVMRNVKAAKELVEATTRLDTVFTD